LIIAEESYLFFFLTKILLLPLGYDALSKSDYELREQTFEVWRHSVAYEVLRGVRADSLDD